MKKVCHTFSVALFVILVLGSVAVTGAVAKEQGPLTEFRLTTDDAVKNAEYGRSVAIDGNLVAVGMGGDVADGAVYLYMRQGTEYVFEEKLLEPNPSAGAEFGRCVAIQGDMVIVGARNATADTTHYAGAVYVFRKYEDSWVFEDKIISPVPQEDANFGRALAIQGNLLVVTARKDSAERGTAYVYAYTDGEWVYQATLEASDSADGDYFGQSVALEGSFLAIGARNTVGPNEESAGGFYLFRKSGNDWIEITKVTPPDGNGDDQYGFAIAMSGDTIVVTARRADPGLTNAGAAYVYSLKGDSVELVTTLTAGDASANDEFGQSVAFAGSDIAVGAWKDESQKGSIYIFHQKDGQWIQNGKIMASDGMGGDEFGYSLAAQGKRMVTGAHKADFVKQNGGAAYVLTVKPLY